MLFRLLVLSLTVLLSQLSAIQYKVIGIGAPITDLLYCIDDEFLNTLPTKKGDGRPLGWEGFSSILDDCKRKGFNPVVATGGSGSNTIKGLACLGNSTAFLGMIGQDSVGNFYRDKIAGIGITPLLIPSPEPTSQVAVFVTKDQQRSFVQFLGAGYLLSASDFNPELFDNVRLVHIEGYMLEDISRVEKAMQIAKSKGATVSLDMSSAWIVSKHKEQILDLLTKYVDIVFANEDETMALTKLPPEKGCEVLMQYAPIAVVLVGKQGCWVGSAEGMFHMPAFEVEAIDTTGAGDLFAAGFLHGYLAGCELRDCAWLGNLLGGMVVTVIGAEIPNEKWLLLKESIDRHFSKK